MKLVIVLPDPVANWLRAKAEQDFRTVKEMATVIIMRAYRDECSEVSSMICRGCQTVGVKRIGETHESSTRKPDRRDFQGKKWQIQSEDHGKGS